MKAMTLMWIGSILIVLSIVLQAIALLLPSFALALTMTGLALNAVSVPFTIVQAYRSALEQQQLLEQERKRNEVVAQHMAIRSPELRLESNLNDRAPDTMPPEKAKSFKRVTTPNETKRPFKRTHCL